MVVFFYSRVPGSARTHGSVMVELRRTAMVGGVVDSASGVVLRLRFILVRKHPVFGDNIQLGFSVASFLQE